MQAAVLGIRHFRNVHKAVHNTATLNLHIDNTAVIALINKGRALCQLCLNLDDAQTNPI